MQRRLEQPTVSTREVETRKEQKQKTDVESCEATPEVEEDYMAQAYTDNGYAEFYLEEDVEFYHQEYVEYARQCFNQATRELAIATRWCARVQADCNRAYEVAGKAQVEKSPRKEML
jgi:hypothetical protein